MSVLASEFEGTLYAIERVTPSGEIKFAPIYMPGSGPHDRVPIAAIRSVIALLDLDDDTFEVRH